MLPSCAQKKTRAIRPSLRFDRISQSPLWPLSDRQSGMPIGHPNSAVCISSPITFRSSGVRPKSQSRTGTLPASDSKNLAGSRFCIVTTQCTKKGTQRQAFSSLFEIHIHEIGSNSMKSWFHEVMVSPFHGVVGFPHSHKKLRL